MEVKESTTLRVDAKTNPYNANQYQLDPRQKLCWDFYTDPKSETFSNGYQSALKAGYEDATATRITTFDWFIEKCSTLNMLDKAERNLNKFLEMDEDTDTKVRVKADVTKFVAERVGKAQYSARTEHTGKNGGAIEFTAEDKEAANKALQDLNE
jgi:hypothetical protein